MRKTNKLVDYMVVGGGGGLEGNMQILWNAARILQQVCGYFKAERACHFVFGGSAEQTPSFD